MDRIDWKILTKLDRNSRTQLSKIAKPVRRSVQNVSYRMARMEKEEIIKGYYSLVDFSKMGFSTWRVMLKFGPSPASEHDSFISFLNKHPKILWGSECGGEWDFLFDYLAGSDEEFHEFIDGLRKRFPSFFRRHLMMVIMGGAHLTRVFLSEDAERRSEFPFGNMRKGEKVTPGALDIGILKIISRNSRVKTTELASRVSASPSSVMKRLKNLEKSVIVGYSTDLDIFKIGKNPYKLLIKMNNEYVHRRKAVLSMGKRLDETFAVLELLGPWDAEIEIEVKDKKRAIEIYRMIYSKFGEEIENISLLELFSPLRYKFFPR
jgi:Lrp/AsnC family leucine-responsive transcriptional regulator